MSSSQCPETVRLVDGFRTLPITARGEARRRVELAGRCITPRDASGMLLNKIQRLLGQPDASRPLMHLPQTSTPAGPSSRCRPVNVRKPSAWWTVSGHCPSQREVKPEGEWNSPGDASPLETHQACSLIKFTLLDLLPGWNSPGDASPVEMHQVASLTECT